MRQVDAVAQQAELVTGDAETAKDAEVFEVLHQLGARTGPRQAFEAVHQRLLPGWVVLSAHMGPEVTTWLDHPKPARWHLQFTPTSSSWLNLAERWFKELPDRRLRRGTFS